MLDSRQFSVAFSQRDVCIYFISMYFAPVILLNSINRYIHSRKGLTNIFSKTCYANLNTRLIVGRAIEAPWKILFIGSDEFSLESLKGLDHESKNGQFIKNLEVATSMKTKANVVQRYAERNLMKIHNWPPKIQKYEFDLGIVVSFGQLIPENVISLFPLGILNVHASILPRWRGAAPIVYAIMNGDEQAGVTVMEVKPHKFDIGGILKQATLPLNPHATFSHVRNELAHLGSKLLLECIKELPENLCNIQKQPKEGITYAPRVLPSLSVVQWNEMSSVQVYNLYRALESLLHLTTKWQGITVKLLKPELVECGNGEDLVDINTVRPGFVFYHKPTKLLRVKCCDNKWIAFRNISVAGKKTMSCADFYNGYISKVSKEECCFE